MINMIPLIDIFLVLLIVFMISIPFLLLNQMSVNLAKTNAGATQQVIKQKTIYVDAAGDYYFSKNNFLSMNDISKIISQEKLNQLSIAADKTVQYQKVIQLIAFLHQNNIQTISLVSTPSSSFPGSR